MNKLPKELSDSRETINLNNYISTTRNNVKRSITLWDESIQIKIFE